MRTARQVNIRTSEQKLTLMYRCFVVVGLLGHVLTMPFYS